MYVQGCGRLVSYQGPNHTKTLAQHPTTRDSHSRTLCLMKAKRMSSRRRRSSEMASTASSSGALGTVAADSGRSRKE